MHRRPFREKSVIAKLLTDKDECQKAIVQTTKRVSFIGEFELFIGLLKGSGLLKVSKLESSSGRYNLKPKPLVCALYVNELIYHLIQKTNINF